MSDLSIQPKAEPAVPAPAEEKPSDTPPYIASEGGDEMPPELHKEAGRMPYLMDLIPGGTLAYDTFSVKELADSVDAYLNSKSDTKERYAAELKILMKKSGAEYENVYIAIDRLAEFVRIENKILESVREKEAFEQKPVEEMSSKELRRKFLATT